MIKVSRVRIISFIIFFIICCVGVRSADNLSNRVPEEKLKLVKILPAKEEERIYFKLSPIIGVDGQDNVYAMLNFESLIFKMDSSGRLLKQIGQFGLGPGDMNIPFLMKIKNDRLFVLDSIGISIFFLDGKFEKKFRVFQFPRGFDIFKDMIVLMEFDSKGSPPFNLYTFDGKKQATFGSLYKLNYKLFKQLDKYMVIHTAHDGKVLCDDNYIYFISYLFGEVFKYDSKGNLIQKKKIEGLDETNNNIIKLNIDRFFISGQSRSKPNKYGSGTGLKASSLFGDAAIHGDRIYLLPASGDYGQILAIDKDRFAVEKKYTYLEDGDSEESFFTSVYLCMKNDSKNGKLSFFISGFNKDDNYIWWYTAGDNVR